MDCVMSSQNAFTVDKILDAVGASTMLIDTTNGMVFHLVTHDRTLVLDFNLEESFFKSLSLKNKCILIPKQKFYIKKIKELKIITNEYVMVFEYVFDKYTLRRRVFYSQSTRFVIDFKIDCTGEINSSAMGLALKEIGDHFATLRVINNTGEICSEGTIIKFPLTLPTDFSVKVIGGNLKSIFEVSDLFIKMIMSYGPTNLSINFVLLGNGTKASFFTAINHNRTSKGA
ncbi:hypothetical protein EROM_080120 [Encephalitozoon romaleae SJ-2008]|uniref:Proliferating cell nuclear antigen n=1 Tax=Encephalitozoon romaleae (strain SJ-2008) TaxID=1178016 RepID=I7AFF1_ENCRO|nr:hypothetical protein EROM_080120 [Encephalitozoon romaleae SJ-2008]AFN83435.1 hypothetical protein EROM_080120 [Encephalitozoon romaleae SJ-2008]